MKSRWRITAKAVLFWDLFIGLGALWGASLMELAPDGHLLHMEAMIPYFQVLPLAEYLYQDYVFPGIALFLINGVPNLIASYLLIRKKKSGIVLSMACGLLLNAWIVIQLVIFPSNFLSNSYFAFSFVQFFTAYAALVFYSQEHNNIDRESYKNTGSDKSKAVVYFSRLGTTERIAYEEADRTGAVIIRLESTERTEGTLGFWWCGRFAMHRWPMPIKHVDASSFDEVTICTPIWVFHIAAPVRQFCLENRGKIKRVNYILTHFQPVGYKGALKEMDKLLDMKHSAAASYGTRLGKKRERWF
ncbi:MAG: flavodoxin family protein [Bullifex sp.]